MKDVVARIDHWLENEHVDDADQTLRDARDEIVALRATLSEARDVLNGAISEIGRYAHRAGYCEGTLWLISAGHTDPAAAAEATLKEVNK